jgi:hypothetical protein
MQLQFCSNETSDLSANLQNGQAAAAAYTFGTGT